MSNMNDTNALQPGVIICSGGLDSTTLLYYLHSKGVDLKAISFDYGQRHNIELEYAQYHTAKLGVPHTIINLKDIFKHVSFASALLGGMDVPTLEEVIGDPQPITYVPFRNMLMLTIAAAIAENTEGEAVYYGAQKHDEYSGYWDTTTTFTAALQEVFQLNRKHKIAINAPFVDLSKSDLVNIGMELGIEYDKTMTCYDPQYPEGKYHILNSYFSADWFAGFVEGDGCFYSKKTLKGSTPGFSITQNDKEILELIKKSLGFGSVALQRKMDNGKDLYSYSTSGTEVSKALARFLSGKIKIPKRIEQFNKWVNDFDLLRPDEALSCGVCPTCRDRLAAFKRAGYTDPAHYQE